MMMGNIAITGDSRLGTTVSNIHVFIPDSPIETQYRKVLSSIELMMHEQGFETVTSANGVQSIHVVYDPKSSWISVYYSDLLQKLPVMPVQLSKIGHPVIEIELFDSDVLQMQLFRAGQIVDTYSDWINYDETPRRFVGNAKIWTENLSVLASSTQLEDAWKHQNEDKPFQSEAVLYRVMDLLKLDKHRLDIDNMLKEEVADYTKVTDLHFRYSKPHLYDVKATGEPVFSLTSSKYAAKLQLVMNFSLSFSVKNLGDESRGVNIEVKGDALDRKLVEPIGLVTTSPFDVWSGKITDLPETHKDDAGSTSYLFKLNDYSIPQGLADWNAVYNLPTHLRDIARESNLQYAIMFAVILKPIHQGKGQITIRITPLANLDGFAEFSCDIEVSP